MVTQFDEKGKIFTNIVTKTPVLVTIQLCQHRIHGQIHVRKDERIKDELNRPEPFIAVTEAVIMTPDGKENLYECHFLLVRADQIQWIFPDNEIIEELSS